MEDISGREDGRGYIAQQLAAEAMAADMDQWIHYNPNNIEEETLEEWLAKYPPSQVYREDGIGWISVRCPTHSEKVPRDSPGLQISWEQLQESKRPINIHIITELAKAHAVTSGKWLIHVDTGLKVDHFWSLVAKATVEGRLGSSAKVSPAELSGENRRHVICIYNDNYTNQEEVYALECAIRNTGIKSHMTYKPDVYTCIGIYRNNEWGLRPTIYESHYDLVKGLIILSHFQDDR